MRACNGSQAGVSDAQRVKVPAHLVAALRAMVLATSHEGTARRCGIGPTTLDKVFGPGQVRADALERITLAVEAWAAQANVATVQGAA